MQLNYDQKLKLVALTQQANHGTFSEENLPALGALDVIGKDRRNAWASLGDISKDESMKGFIDGVAESMPHLQPYIEAIKKEKESIKKQELEAQEKAVEEAKIAQEADEERQRFGFCEKYILSILSDFLNSLARETDTEFCKTSIRGLWYLNWISQVDLTMCFHSGCLVKTKYLMERS